MAKGISRKDLEQRLTAALVPVEPSQDFMKVLQARLVTYHGGQSINGWMIFAVFAMAAVLAISALGLVVRILVSLAGLIGLILNRRGSSSRQDLLPT
jgi:small-conductance mechanosensitive channel